MIKNISIVQKEVKQIASNQFSRILRSQFCSSKRCHSQIL